MQQQHKNNVLMGFDTTEINLFKPIDSVKAKLDYQIRFKLFRCCKMKKKTIGKINANFCIGHNWLAPG